ncbi:MAG: hypothetical protein MHPSP_001373 [Paramarteilia canceri]
MVTTSSGQGEPQDSPKLDQSPIESEIKSLDGEKTAENCSENSKNNSHPVERSNGQYQTIGDSGPGIEKEAMKAKKARRKYARGRKHPGPNIHKHQIGAPPNTNRFLIQDHAYANSSPYSPDSSLSEEDKTGTDIAQVLSEDENNSSIEKALKVQKNSVYRLSSNSNSNFFKFSLQIFKVPFNTIERDFQQLFEDIQNQNDQQLNEQSSLNENSEIMENNGRTLLWLGTKLSSLKDNLRRFKSDLKQLSFFEIEEGLSNMLKIVEKLHQSCDMQK